MKTVLFINGCVRDENSRTLKITRTYIDKLQKNETIRLIERNLTAEPVEFLTDKSFDPSTGDQMESDVRAAKQFALADDIILAAPFWEYLFPAVVSCYFESISVAGVTFKYTDTGSVGLCKAGLFTYIYTAGAFLNEEDRINERYMKKMTELYGITKLSVISAEGLDVDPSLADGIVEKTCKKILRNI